jgi:hypothetical protein
LLKDLPIVANDRIAYIRAAQGLWHISEVALSARDDRIHLKSGRWAPAIKPDFHD